MSNYTSNDIINAIAAAAKALEARKDEINRLNVFPVPDGDTGTNMSLTLAMVVDNLAKLPIGASSEDRRRAITTGALMGARGNSGVITSQIMRGLCEGIADHEEFDIVAVDDAFSRAVEVAFNAVRSRWRVQSLPFCATPQLPPIRLVRRRWSSTRVCSSSWASPMLPFSVRLNFFLC